MTPLTESNIARAVQGILSDLVRAEREAARRDDEIARLQRTIALLNDGMTDPQEIAEALLNPPGTTRRRTDDWTNPLEDLRPVDDTTLSDLRRESVAGNARALRALDGYRQARMLLDAKCLRAERGDGGRLMPVRQQRGTAMRKVLAAIYG